MKLADIRLGVEYKFDGGSGPALEIISKRVNTWAQHETKFVVFEVPRPNGQPRRVEVLPRFVLAP